MTRQTGTLNRLYLVFFLSGAAGLGYQMAWTRMFSVALGHEMAGLLAVVAAFFGGLALGSWLLDGPVSRSVRPGHWYVGLEILIGVWGFISILAIPWANTLAIVWLGVDPTPLWHSVVSFGIPLLVLLPATTAMGATLPAMERFVAPRTTDGRVVGALYAANTAGAVAGTLLSAFFIMPTFGYRASVITLAIVNLCCALLICPFLRSAATNDSRSTCREWSSTPMGGSRWRVFSIIFVTGLLGIGYEVVGIRVLSQVIENTVYSYAAVLSVYLIGTAWGAFLYQRYGARVDDDNFLGCLFCVLSVACIVGGLTLSAAEEIYMSCRRLFGDSMLAVLLAEMGVAGTVFLAPTTLMGATFSHLVQSARRAIGGVGQAMALNTLGGFIAPYLFGVVLLPAVGAKWVLVIASLGFLPLAFSFRIKPVWLAALAPLLVLALPADLRMVRIHEQQSLLEYREGITAAVSVIGDTSGHRSLRVNNCFTMGGTATRTWELRQGHLPLLLHPAPRQAMYLGLGTGITFEAARHHPDLRSDGVELVPEVVEVLPHFQSVESLHAPDSQTTVHVADARRFVRSTELLCDVVVADLFHPGRDGGGMLYTRNHFQAVRNRLRNDGLFCQWLPLYQLDEPTLRVILRTFLDVFPNTYAILSAFDVQFPALGLVGYAASEPVQYPSNWYQVRVRDQQLAEHLETVGLANGFDLLGCFVAGPDSLHRYAGDAVINTDNHPVVVFDAPVFKYQLRVTGFGRLFTMLQHVDMDPQQLIQSEHGAGDIAFRERLARFIEARNLYFESGVPRSRDETIEHLLRSAEVSADFVPAYDAAFAFARREADSAPATVRGLLNRLIQVRPERNEALDLLRRLP